MDEAATCAAGSANAASSVTSHENCTGDVDRCLRATSPDVLLSSERRCRRTSHVEAHPPAQALEVPPPPPRGGAPLQRQRQQQPRQASVSASVTRSVSAPVLPSASTEQHVVPGLRTQKLLHAFDKLVQAEESSAAVASSAPAKTVASPAPVPTASTLRRASTSSLSPSRPPRKVSTPPLSPSPPPRKASTPPLSPSSPPPSAPTHRSASADPNSRAGAGTDVAPKAVANNSVAARGAAVSGSAAAGGISVDSAVARHGVGNTAKAAWAAKGQRRRRGKDRARSQADVAVGKDADHVGEEAYASVEELVIECLKKRDNAPEDSAEFEKVDTGLFQAALGMLVSPRSASHPTSAGAGLLLLQRQKEKLWEIAGRPPPPEVGDAEDESEVVRRLFFDSVPQRCVKIGSVHQVMQPQLLSRFLLGLAESRASVQATFHGTHERNVSGILQNGIMPGMCAKGVYGHGAYVAIHAGTAHQYADPGPDGWRHMCVVLIAVGGRHAPRGGPTTCPVFVTPPGAPSSTRCSTKITVDSMANPTQYCVINEARMYVSHLLKYRVVGGAWGPRVGGMLQDPFQRELMAAVSRAGKVCRRHSCLSGAARRRSIE